MSKDYAIIPAAGLGIRFGGETRKQYLELAGHRLLDWVLDAFVSVKIFEKIVVCVPEDDVEELKKNNRATVDFIAGGNSRSESVAKGFASLDLDDDDIVLIHDAVRPLVSPELIRRVLKQTQEKGACIPVVPVADTIKEKQGDKIVKTYPRHSLVAVQTPQGFKASFLQKAYQSLPYADPRFTDEAMLVEENGVSVFTVEGDRVNIKVTTPLDLKLAAYYLETT